MKEKSTVISILVNLWSESLYLPSSRMTNYECWYLRCDINEGGHRPPSELYRCMQYLSFLGLGVSLLRLSHFWMVHNSWHLSFVNKRQSLHYFARLLFILFSYALCGTVGNFKLLVRRARNFHINFCRVNMSFLIKYRIIRIFQFLLLVVFLYLPLVYPLNGGGLFLFCFSFM